MEKYFLGIDNGGTMAKAAVFDEHGKEIAVAAEKVELLHPQQGWEEVDMEELWRANVRTIRSVIEKACIDPRDIAGIACTGHGNGMYLIDEDGNGLRGIRSTDGRARKVIDMWNADNTLQKILPKTMQAIWAAQPNTLLRWMMDNDRETLDKARWMFMVKDFIRFRLTGNVAIDRTDLSGTSLINVGTGEYDDEVLEAWGILEMKRLMPPIVDSAEICGAVTSKVAAITGLAEGTPVAGGMFDIDACGLGVGMVNEDSLCLISGTWGNNQYISKTPVVSPDVFMTSCYSIPGYYLMLEGSATSASNLEWMITEFFDADKALMKQDDPESSIYSLVNELVGKTSPADCGLLFLPYLYASPVSLDAKACFFGLDGWQNRGHVLRAMCEGIVFGHYWHIERLLKFRKMPNPILLAGGAAKSSVWAQMFADIFQTRVDIPNGTELGTLGAAIAAAVAVGTYASYEEACQNMVCFSRRYTPDPAKAEAYARKYANFKKLLEILQPHWAELAW